MTITDCQEVDALRDVLPNPPLQPASGETVELFIEARVRRSRLSGTAFGFHQVYMASGVIWEHMKRI